MTAAVTPNSVTSGTVLTNRADHHREPDGDRREPAFRIAHRPRRIAVDGAEVALPVHQQVAQREGLRHAHQGVVHRLVAVRVIFANDIADHGAAQSAEDAAPNGGCTARAG